MTGYKDMTFCTFFGDCKDGDTCHRALTKEVKKDAVTWWCGSNPPISMFAEEPNCFEQKPEIQENETND